MGVVIPLSLCRRGRLTESLTISEGGMKHDATFAVSPNGYMDDKVGLEDLQSHCEPKT